MDEDKEPTQETPEGHEIPIPTREDVFRDLEKVAKKPRPNGGAGRENESQD